MTATRTVGPRRVRVRGDLYHGQLPEGAVYVGRTAPGLPGSVFRNPFTVRKHGRARALELFREHLDRHPYLVDQARRELAGRDLACWCRLDEPCHADVWLDILANPPT
ncbi:DUF4326 domain-containing protein [Nonomuraea sp. NPDC026600]|uniref:DUF4326 domain-containing protein n=1 Tax=Nonomuraea sp. NPDC026600 TaxID=3155363 RepID=UPI0033EA50B9